MMNISNNFGGKRKCLEYMDMQRRSGKNYHLETNKINVRLELGQSFCVHNSLFTEEISSRGL